MIRILQILNNINVNGTETFVMNVFRNLDRNKIMFDFLVSGRTNSSFEKEILEMGGNIHTFSPRRQGWRKHIKSLHNFFRDNSSKYQGVHIHGNSFTGMMPLAIASLYNVPIRIAHCHNTSTQGYHNQILHKLNKLRINKIATHFFACSQPARDYGFGGTKAFSNSIVVNNGIELQKFKFNPTIRVTKRKELGIKDEIVIGNVAAFRDAKNHVFMIQIMKEIIKAKPDAKLLLVGEGPLRSQIEKMSENYGLRNNIVFLGSRSDVEELLQAMDIFLFPSKYEGLGISLIEAQAAGLPVIASDVIPKETNVTPLIKYLPLQSSPEKWAEAVLNSLMTERDIEYPELKKFDIAETCRQLTRIYTGE